MKIFYTKIYHTKVSLHENFQIYRTWKRFIVVVILLVVNYNWGDCLVKRLLHIVTKLSSPLAPSQGSAGEPPTTCCCSCSWPWSKLPFTPGGAATTCCYTAPGPLSLVGCLYVIFFWPRLPFTFAEATITHGCTAPFFTRGVLIWSALLAQARRWRWLQLAAVNNIAW